MCFSQVYDHMNAVIIILIDTHVRVEETYTRILLHIYIIDLSF